MSFHSHTSGRVTRHCLGWMAEVLPLIDWRAGRSIGKSEMTVTSRLPHLHSMLLDPPSQCHFTSSAPPPPSFVAFVILSQHSQFVLCNIDNHNPSPTWRACTVHDSSKHCASPSVLHLRNSSDITHLAYYHIADTESPLNFTLEPYVQPECGIRTPSSRWSPARVSQRGIARINGTRMSSVLAERRNAAQQRVATPPDSIALGPSVATTAHRPSQALSMRSGPAQHLHLTPSPSPSSSSLQAVCTLDPSLQHIVIPFTTRCAPHPVSYTHLTLPTKRIV